MQRIKELFKSKLFSAGASYTLGNILIKGISFITLPLFSRMMTTEEFGLYNVFVSYEAILFVIIGFAIHGSIQSANKEFEGRINEYTSCVTIVYFCSLICLLVLYSILHEPVKKIVRFDAYVSICLLLYSFSSAVLMLYNARVSLDYDYKRYLVVSLFSSIGNIVLSLLLMTTIFKNERAYGRITGITSTGIIIATYILYFFYKKSPFLKSFSTDYLSFAIKYSLPIVPHGLAQVLLAQFDRIMIRDIIGNSSAGIYSLAGNIQLILNVITTSLATAWATWFFENVGNKPRQFIQKRSRQLCYLFLIISVCLLLIVPELVLLLGGRAYDTAKYAAIPLIVVGFILFVYNIIVQAEYYKKKTIYIMAGTLIAAIINVITNSVFIRKFGFIAAAYTTLFSYICYLVLHTIIAKKCAEFYVLSLSDYFIDFGIIIGTSIFALLFINSFYIRIVFLVLLLSILFTVGKRKVF